jgi:hypothetical protein
MLRFVAFLSGAVTLTGVAALAPASAQVSETCPNGLVWREAYPSDHLCVTPDLHAQVRADSGSPRAPAARSNAPTDPFLGVSGPNDPGIVDPRGSTSVSWGCSATHPCACISLGSRLN